MSVLCSRDFNYNQINFVDDLYDIFPKEPKLNSTLLPLITVYNTYFQWKNVYDFKTKHVQHISALYINFKECCHFHISTTPNAFHRNK